MDPNSHPDHKTNQPTNQPANQPDNQPTKGRVSNINKLINIIQLTYQILFNRSEYF